MNNPIAAKLAEALRHARKELEGACTALDILCVHAFNVVDEALAEYDTAKDSPAWQPISTRPDDGQQIWYYFEPFGKVYIGVYQKSTDSVRGFAGFTTVVPEVPFWIPAIPPQPPQSAPEAREG